VQFDSRDGMPFVMARTIADAAKGASVHLLR
jgi:hypothetical protein